MRLVHLDLLLEAVDLHELIHIFIGVGVGGWILILEFSHQKLQKIIGGDGGRRVAELPDDCEPEVAAFAVTPDAVRQRLKGRGCGGIV